MTGRDASKGRTAWWPMCKALRRDHLPDGGNMITIPDALRTIADGSTDTDRMALRRLARRAKHVVETRGSEFPDIAAIPQARLRASLDDCARRFGAV